MRMRTKPHPHPVISEATPTSSYKKGPEVLAVFALACTFPEVLNSWLVSWCLLVLSVFEFVA